MMKYNNAILLCTDFGDIDWLFVILKGIANNQTTRDIIYIAYPDHLMYPVIDFIDVVFVPVKLPVLNEPPVVGKVSPSIYCAQLLRLAALDELHKNKMASKVLYLDNDILLLGDIGILFSETDAPIRALHSVDADPSNSNHKHGYYFSGVMLFNLESFYIKIGINNLMDEFYRVYTPTLFVYSDEEFLNSLCGAEMLSSRYNYQVQFNKRISSDTIAMHFAWFKPNKKNLYYYVEYQKILMLLISLVDNKSKLYLEVAELIESISTHKTVFGVSSL